MSDTVLQKARSGESITADELADYTKQCGEYMWEVLKDQVFCLLSAKETGHASVFLESATEFSNKHVAMWRDLDAKTDNMDKKQAARREQTQARAEEIKGLKDQIGALKNARTVLTAKNDGHVKEVALLKGEIEALDTKVHNIRIAFSALQSQRDECLETINALKAVGNRATTVGLTKNGKVDLRTRKQTPKQIAKRVASRLRNKLAKRRVKGTNLDGTPDRRTLPHTKEHVDRVRAAKAMTDRGTLKGVNKDGSPDRRCFPRTE